MMLSPSLMDPPDDTDDSIASLLLRHRFFPPAVASSLTDEQEENNNTAYPSSVSNLFIDDDQRDFDGDDSPDSLCPQPDYPDEVNELEQRLQAHIRNTTDETEENNNNNSDDDYTYRYNSQYNSRYNYHYSNRHKEGVLGEEQEEGEGEEDTMNQPEEEEDDDFDWATSAELAIRTGRPEPQTDSNNTNINTINHITTEGSTVVVSPSSSSSSTTTPDSSSRESTLLPVAVVEDKAEPHSPSVPPLPLTRLTSVSPSSSSPSSTAALTSPLSVSHRLSAYALIIAHHVSLQEFYREELLDTITAVRRILSTTTIDPTALIDCTHHTSLIADCVTLLTHRTSAQVQLESAWILTNLAAADQVALCVEAGAIPATLAHVGLHANAAVMDQCIWFLGNVAGDCAEYRDDLLNMGFLLKLCELLPSVEHHTSLTKNITWCFHNLCRNKPSPACSKVTPLIPLLQRMLLHNTPPNSHHHSHHHHRQQHHPQIISNVLWALSCLSDLNDTTRASLIEAGFLDRLMLILQQATHAPHSVPDTIITPALRSIGNFLSGGEESTQSVIDAGFIQFIPKLIQQSNSEFIRKESCWAVSNIAAGTASQIQALINEPQLLPMIFALIHNAPTSIRKEAVWVACNLCEGGDQQQLHYFVHELSGINVLTAALLYRHAAIQAVAATAIHNLYRKCPAYVQETHTLEMVHQVLHLIKTILQTHAASPSSMATATAIDANDATFTTTVTVTTGTASTTLPRPTPAVAVSSIGTSSQNRATSLLISDPLFKHPISAEAEEEWRAAMSDIEDEDAMECLCCLRNVLCFLSRTEVEQQQQQQQHQPTRHSHRSSSSASRLAQRAGSSSTNRCRDSTSRVMVLYEEAEEVIKPDDPLFYTAT